MTAELATNDMTDDQVDLIRRTICKDATPDELALFLGQCRRTGLDPFAKQLYAVFRFDKNVQRKIMTLQTGIDGFRLIASRTGEYEGQVGPFWCGKDGVWRDVWLEDGVPFAAKVGVLRKGFREPTWGVARFAAYSQPTPFWSRMGDGMIAKVAESIALRKSFPQELSGLYSAEEMDQADRPEAAEVVHRPEPPRQIAAPVVAAPVADNPTLVKVIATAITGATDIASLIDARSLAKDNAKKLSTADKESLKNTFVARERALTPAPATLPSAPREPGDEADDQHVPY